MTCDPNVSDSASMRRYAERLRMQREPIPMATVGKIHYVRCIAPTGYQRLVADADRSGLNA